MRKLIPSTIPIVTGEDGTTDSALRSRYVRLIASQSYDQSGDGDESDAQRKASHLTDQRRRDARCPSTRAAIGRAAPRQWRTRTDGQAEDRTRPSRAQ